MIFRQNTPHSVSVNGLVTENVRLDNQCQHSRKALPFLRHVVANTDT